MLSCPRRPSWPTPSGAFDDLQQQLSQAIADTIDTAVLFGKDTKTGTALTGVESVNDTPHVVTLDPAQEATAGYIGKQVSAAYDKVVLQSDAAGDYDVNQFIFSPAMRSKVVNASDTLGRPLYQGSLNLKDRCRPCSASPPLLEDHQRPWRCR